jgi:repressor LexA
LNEELSDRQSRILEYIRHVSRTRNYPPSVREIGEAVGLSSSSTVHNHLNQLERRGLIHRDPSKSRTVQLVKDAREADVAKGAIRLPLVGNVAAGTPILAEQNIEDHILISESLAQEGWFLLKVRGDSMVNAGILDGDLVLVRPQPSADNGQIIVAMVDGEATCKRLDRRNGQIRLLPENDDYQPIVAPDTQVVGLVKGVMRFLN